MTDNRDADNRRSVLLAQYNQVCEDYRQLDRLAWQIPSLVTAVGGTLVVVAFSAMTEAVVPARELVLGIAFMLIVGMSFILLRHRYFQAIMVGTLSEIEKELEALHVQRIPFPRKYDVREPTIEMYPKGLLYQTTPRSILKDGTPGPRLLFWLMLTMALGIVALMVYIIVEPRDPVLSCVERGWALGVFLALFMSVILGVWLVKKGEDKSMAEESKKNPDTKAKEKIGEKGK